MPILETKIVEILTNGGTSVVVLVLLFALFLFARGGLGTVVTFVLGCGRRRTENRSHRMDRCIAVLNDSGPYVSAELKRLVKREYERLLVEELYGVRLEYEEIAPFLTLLERTDLKRNEVLETVEKMKVVDGEFHYRPDWLDKGFVYITALYSCFVLAVCFFDSALMLFLYISAHIYNWIQLVLLVVCLFCFAFSRIALSADHTARSLEKVLYPDSGKGGTK